MELSEGLHDILKTVLKVKTHIQNITYLLTLIVYKYILLNLTRL